MTSKLLPEIKSKEACRRCGEHRLFTNDSEKEDSVIHYHCLNCNAEYNETSDSKDYKKRKAKEKKKDDAPSSFLGLAIFVLMMFVILTITVDQERKRDAAAPLNSTELTP
ncbi:MAG: hypothetical protein AAFV85_17560 [Cyanobacteria bacterium J06634_6]